MDMDVIIGCGIFLAIVGYLVYAKPWKNEEFIAAEEAAVVVLEPEPVVEEAPVVVIEPEDAPKPKRGRKGKN
jgi:hypothetical protein